MTGSVFNSTRQEIYEYMKKETANLDLIHFDNFMTSTICNKLNISRNLTSQYLNEGFKEGDLIKINTRPVYYFERKTVMAKYELEQIDSEFYDLEEFISCIRKKSNEKLNFEKGIGYNLSLKQAIDKCKVAVDYPKNGLPFYLVGERGTGKEYLARLAYEYAIEHRVVSKESRFVLINCAIYDLKDWDAECIKINVEQKLKTITENDFVYVKHFEMLSDEAKFALVEFWNPEHNDSIYGRSRLIISSSERVGALHSYIQQLIPIQIELPTLSNRTLVEKELLVCTFLRNEEKVFRKSIQISEQSYQVLTKYHYKDNIRQLEKVIKSICARAFSTQKERENIVISYMDLPKEIVQEIHVEITPMGMKEKFLTLNQIYEHTNFFREKLLCDQIIEKLKLYISEKIEYTQFLRESYQILDEYNDYILYNRTMEDERIRFIEQTLLKIFAYIQDNYGINMPNTFIIVFARWIYDSGMFHEILIKWKSENEQDVETLNRIMERQSTGEMVLAKEIVGLVEQNLEIELSNIEEIMLTIMLYNVKGAKKVLPVQAYIICHGYATASSIADVCNKVLCRHIFSAIDMPLDKTINDICMELRKMLYYSEKREVLFLVDIGSLEHIVDMIGDTSNVNVGIINNVSTNLAIRVGTAIMNGENVEQIIANTKGTITTSYNYFPKKNSEDALIFVSESGSNVAARVSELFLNSLPKNLHVTIKCYDYETFIALNQADELEKYHVIFAATTIPLGKHKFPIVSIEDIMTFRNFEQLKICFNGYLSAFEFETFKKNMLNAFSLQNVVESLTILNATKVLTLVDEMLEELQLQMQQRFLPKTIMGLNVHISCLIERMVKKEEIGTHLNLTEFVENNSDFIEKVRRSFANIAKQYNIELVMSEIAYIYDYINHDFENENEEEEDF